MRTPPIDLPAVDDSAPPPPPVSGPVEWVRTRLFPNRWSGVVSVLLIVVVAIVGYRSLVFVFVNARWEAASRNLTLFMLGTFPRGEQWRVVVQLFLLATAVGVGAGTASATGRDKAAEAGLPYRAPRLSEVVRRFWSLIAFVVVLLIMATTGTPWLVAGGAVVTGYVGWQARLLPSSLRTAGWLIAVMLAIAAFQLVSGTHGGAWIPTAAVAAVAVVLSLPGHRIPTGPVGTLVKVGAVLIVGIAIRSIYGTVGVAAIGWDRWSGLQLTLWWSALVIALSFPIGLLLALARRSSLPALRYIATGYIELIRGVPLITLLFMGHFILGFFLPAGTTLSAISRSIAAGTLFTAAYVAEIVRGGLQSLHPGQAEAGQALGLAPTAVMRKIILPQALRAVIPAMVGQFISLFKDSSLLFIITIIEFLGVRSLIHAQADFRGSGHAETLIFVAVGYWAFSYAMSRESQRLERKLGVGER